MRTPLFLLLASILLSISCEDILEVPDISNQRVELLAPAQGSSVNDSLVNFNWSPVIDAEAYLIQVATPDFDNPDQIVLDSLVIIDSTFVGTRVSKTLSNGSYGWRVKAQNSGFETEFSLNAFSVEAPSN